MDNKKAVSSSTNKKYWYSFSCGVNSENVGKFIDFVLGKVHSDINPEFTLYLSSLGGDMDSAIRFYDFTKALNLKINTVGYGQVQSAAIMLFLCG